jgi:hypothetical protein
MTNVVNQWERKAIRYIRKAQEGVSCDFNHSVYYQKAMAYCDCIQNFTYDKDRFDCFDRLVAEYHKQALENA